ncbi:hypothetical protein HMSSN139_39410 [Paenibacillus sp. HMSSN-139]|nr:hypothetical protein HMSSN139_39410 [Paenibacillus sp. HMSSN-139]
MLKDYKKWKRKKIPESINYDDIQGLAIEARQKLSKIRPISIGQASRDFGGHAGGYLHFAGVSRAL